MDPFVNPFRELLKQPSVPLGTWLMSGAESTAEAMGCAGFDWLVVDMEHVPSITRTRTTSSKPLLAHAPHR